MLRLLLDEQISPIVATRLKQKRKEIEIYGLIDFENGRYRARRDEILLEVAYVTRLTLVTYDLSTIPPILKQWGEEGRAHGGLILIDDRTIANDAFGELVKALEKLWDAEHELDWCNRTKFLKP
jgi:hypothetical protein